MNKIVQAIIKHPVTIIMITALLFFGGIFGVLNMSTQLIPNIQIPKISVIVTYPGASAATVEETVTNKLEGELSNVSGVTDVNTFSYDNVSAVILSFDFGTSLDEKVSLITEKANKADLPDGCEDPEVSAVDVNGLATVTFYITDKRDRLTTGNVPNAAAVAEVLSGKLLALDGVSSVQIDGNPVDEITIKPISGLENTILLLAESLSGGQYDLPLGDIAATDGAVQIRNLSDVKNMDEIRALPIELPASVVSSLRSLKDLSEYYEKRSPEQIADFTRAVKDEIRPAMANLDARYPADISGAATQESKLAARKDAALKYYISLLSYPSATLWTLNRSDYYVSLMEAVKDKTDKEIYDYVNQVEGYAGFTVSAETLFMAREQANAAAEESKGLNAILEFKRAYTDFHEFTDAEHCELAVKMGLSADEAEAAPMTDFIRTFSREGLSETAKRRFFDEPLNDGDYARLFSMTDLGNRYPLITTETGMKFIRSDSFDANAAVLYDFKIAHPGSEAGYLSDDEIYELYTLLDTAGIIEYGLSIELIRFIRATDFGNGGALTVKLSDIANAVGPGDSGYMPKYEAFAYHNGIQGVKISVYASNGANGTDVVKEAKSIVAQMTTSDATFEIALTDDQSEFIGDSVNNVLVSMLIGGLLAVLVIFLFLKKLKPSVIISVTMPLSVLAALLLLYAMGITLNMVSLGGLAVGIGMLVDNSIVVIEAISKRRDAGDGAFRAAINGTSEVAGALVGSTLTTVCVFVPILFVGGLSSQIFTDLSWAVIWSLTFSLLVAVTVIPTLYALFSGERRMLRGNYSDAATPESERPVQKPEQQFRAKSEPEVSPNVQKPKRKLRVMEGVSNLYAKALPAILGKKAIVLTLALVLFGASIGLVFLTGSEFLPSVDKGLIDVNLGYYGGASLQEAEADAKTLADLIALQVPDAESVSVSVGVQGLLSFDNTGSISVKLKQNASNSTKEVTETVRKLTEKARADGLLPKTSTASVTEIDGVVESITGGMNDLSATIVGEDPDALRIISDKILEKLRGKEFVDAGFRSVTGSLSDENTTKQLNLDLDRTAISDKGLDYGQVVMTLRAGLAGYTSAKVDFGGGESDVIVSFADDTFLSVEELLDFTVGFYEGEAVKLSDVAAAEIVNTYTAIKKLDGMFTALITAEVYRLDNGTAGKMMERAAREALAETYEAVGKSFAEMGYEFRTSGVSDYLNDAFDGLIVALAISFFLLFAVMAAQFESITKPLIIMSSIPFSFTGGFIALVITGTTLNVVSFVGIIMLMGVIVNNAIVLLEKIRQLYDDGASHYQAVVEGCRARLRPVLMTTLTTVLALIPLALGLGSGGELMQPLGIVVLGGLTLGTLVTLFVTPSIYCLVKGISKSRPCGRAHKENKDKQINSALIE